MKFLSSTFNSENPWIKFGSRCLAFAVGVYFVQVAASFKKFQFSGFLDLSAEAHFDCALPWGEPDLKAPGQHFGSSILTNWDEKDPDHGSVTDYLNSTKVIRFGRISGDAMAPEVYLEYVRFFKKVGADPRILIFEINMRSFSAEWNHRPAYQFVREKSCLALSSPWTRALLKPLAVYRAIDLTPVSEKEWRAEAVFDEDQKIGTIADAKEYWKDEANAEKYSAFFTKLFYMYSLSPGHPKIAAAKKIIEELRGTNTKFLFYVSPINYEFGNRVVGPRFEERLKKNVQVIREALPLADKEWLDLSTRLTEPEFSHSKHIPNEHLKKSGRVAVATWLAKSTWALFNPL